MDTETPARDDVRVRNLQARDRDAIVAIDSAHVGRRFLGLGSPRLQTEVQWESPDLLAFFQPEGFVLAQRVCLDLDLERTRR